MGLDMRTGNHKQTGRLSFRGFTLLELMIVIAIITILVGIAAGAYTKSVQRAKEATLKSDLAVMRQAIDHYTLDKEAAPQSLEDLTNPQSQYLREIPKDPITDQKDWHVDFGDTVMSPDQTTTGLVDVHSNSDKVSPNEGTPYNTW
jgi:general secretion pathway protein G